ncbi:MAG: methylmalonyl-CoA epimerase [Proteobacteria bacterium]|nr:methylmalonyl-CoA epimerase [Pseudomonadota bacterium]
MINKIDHIGIAVDSLEAAIEFYEKTLGLKCVGREEIVDQKVKTAFFHVGEVHIELLEPTSQDSPVAKYLEKKGPGVHHIAYGTDDVKEQLDRVESKGCKLIDKEPRDGAGGKEIAFLHPKSTLGVLTEFCQKK